MASAHVREVGVIHLSSEGSYAVFSVAPAVDPESSAAERLVAGVRGALGRLCAHTGIEVVVGGTTASQLDLEQSIAGGMWQLVAAVLLASFVILTVLCAPWYFR
jgi:putative drug exporter of the RND superfamily